jgi:hypothetical protein
MEKKYWNLDSLPYLPYRTIRYHFLANSCTGYRPNSKEQFISPLMAHLYITPNQKPPTFIHSSLPNLQSWKLWTASESRTALLSFVQMIEKAKMKWKRMSTTDTKRVTLAVALEASGRMLPPLLIFKGTQKGQISNYKLPSYPDGGHYSCQPKAWMDDHAMDKWIDLVLIPWKIDKAPGIVPLLILDAYHVHMMGNIVNRIQSLGIEVIRIPPGCTHLCQPVDWALTR